MPPHFPAKGHGMSVGTRGKTRKSLRLAQQTATNQRPLPQQGLGKFTGIECLQVFKLLAYANKINRNGPFARYGAQYATLGGAVELGDDQAGDVDRLVERLDLRQGVLPEVGVEHQQRFVRPGRVGLLDDAAVILGAVLTVFFPDGD